MSNFAILGVSNSRIFQRGYLFNMDFNLAVSTQTAKLPNLIPRQISGCTVQHVFDIVRSDWRI